MPTYDYQCRSCGHTIEVIHSMKEEGPTACERCGGQLRRVFFPAGIIFKGSGFYKTDSRSSSASSSSTSSSSAAESSSESSSPTSKPASSGDTKTPAGGGAESSGGAPAASASDLAKKD